MEGPMADWSDEKLARYAQRGDQDAFRVLFDRHAERLKPRIRPRLNGILRRKVAESDVIQMTYLSAHQSLARFEDRGAGSFRAWLDQILEHRLKDVVRRFVIAEKRGIHREVTGPEPADPGRYPSPQRTPSMIASGAEFRRAVEEAIPDLPAPYREILELVQGRGLSLAEAGEELSKSRGAAKQLYARALGRLRELVRKRKGEPFG